MRVVWRGTISFGLVTIPVALYAATESKSIPSRQIHVPDGGRVQYKRVCSVDGAEVPYEEIGRGYESATGELVMLSDVDLAALPAKTSRSIEVVSFLPLSAIDPIYFDRSYYVEPERPGTRAYRLMRDALTKLGRVAVAKVSLRDREITALLRPHGKVLVLATMLWSDEVRTPGFGFLAEEDTWVAPGQEVAMAEALIESLSDEQLDPDRYRDVHRETLTALIDAKATGLAPAPAAASAGAAPPDLLEALRASIAAAKQRQADGAGVRGGGGARSGTGKKKREAGEPAKKASAEPAKEPAAAGRGGRSAKKRD